jgi:hypothetical protein
MGQKYIYSPMGEVAHAFPTQQAEKHKIGPSS